MRNKTLLFTLCALCILTCQYGCTSIGERELSGDGMTSQMDIKGYKPFVIFQSRYLLGSLVAEQNIWRDPIYRGRPTHNPVSGEYAIEYSKNQLTEAKVALEGVVNVEGALEKFKSVKLILENPEEFQFEKMCLPIKDKDNAELRKLKYISALLKAKRIRIEFLAKDGTKIDTEADLKKFNLQLGAKVQKEEKVSGIYFAENTFVGYKLSDPKEIIEVCPEKSNAKVLVLPFKWISKVNSDEDYSRMLRFEAENVLNTISLKFNKQLIKAPVGNVFVEAEKYINSKDKEDYHSNVITEYASRTDANLIVIGKFIRYGNMARVTVEFKDNSGSTVPTQYIDYSLNDLDKPNINPSSFITEWSVKVSNAFQSNLQESQVVKVTENNEAYSFYVKGVEEKKLLDEENLLKAMDKFEKTIKLDPNLTEAYAMLCETILSYLEIHYFNKGGFNVLSDTDKKEIKELSNKAKLAGEKAVALNPDNFLGHRALAKYYYIYPDQKASEDYITQKTLDEINLKSKAYIEKSISLNKMDSESYWQLFLTKVRLDNSLYTSENEDLKKAKALNSSSLEGLFQLAKVFYSKAMYADSEKEKASFYPKAEELFEEILKKSYNHIPSILSLIELYAENKKFEEALGYLKKAENIYISLNRKKDCDLYSRFADYYKSKEEYTTSESYYWNCLKEDSEHFSSYIHQVTNIYTKYLKDQKEWRKIFDEAILRDPKNEPDYLNWIGIIYLEKNSQEEGIKYIEQSIEKKLRKNPSDKSVVVPYITLGSGYQESGKYDLAIENYKKTLDINLNQGINLMVYDLISSCYLEKKSFDLAIEYTNKILDYNKSKYNTNFHISLTESYDNLGKIYLGKKEYSKALEFYNQSLEIKKSKLADDSSQIIQSYKYIGKVYIHKNDEKKATDYYDLAIKSSSNPKDKARVNVDFANSYENKPNPDYKKAISYYKKAIKIETDNEKVKIYKTKIVDLETLLVKGNTDGKANDKKPNTRIKEDRSSVTLKKRIKDLKSNLNEKNFVVVNLEIAKIYQESEEPLTAIVYYEKILEKDPKNETVNLELGKYYLKKKNPIKAEKYISALEKKHKEKLLSEDTKVRAEAYLGLAKIAKLLGNLPEEKEYLKTRENILKMK